MNLISAKSLSIRLGNKSICDGLDLDIDTGQRWGVLGRNGIGKTTLLKYLAGLLSDFTGSISLKDTSINEWKRKDLAREIGVLFQDSQDTFPTTVIETALIGRHPYLPFWSFEGNEDLDIATRALADVALTGMENRQINTLSGGERRRLAIASLLVQKPRIWLLDEPTNHLDLHHQITLLKVILDYVDTAEGALFMVLHDVNLVTRFCSHAMLMVDAGTILTGTVQEVVTQDNLTLMYGHPVHHIQVDGNSYFFPE